MRMLRWIMLVLLMIDISNSLSNDPSYIYSGLVWNDTDGKSIQGHAAGILIDPIDKSYWWYGGSLQSPDVTLHSVNCYHSKDLLNWVNVGEVLGQKQIHVEGLPGPYKVERPKVVWNSQTNLFVMWFHLDSVNHSYRLVGVATSSTPNGRFEFVDGFEPDGIPSLDMSLYEDKINGIVHGVYLVRSCNNSYVGISKLTDDYLNTSGITSRIDEPREGHAIFYRNNHYYMMTSHLTGWNPNPAELFISDGDKLQGAKWISLGNPTGSSTTFNSQSTFVLPFPSTKSPGEDFYIYMGDRWDPPQLINATYVWLPFNFHSDTNVTLQWIDQWTLTDY